jgi:hypothetical protein
MSDIATPDLFMLEVRNCDIASARPAVPAAGVRVPPIMPPIPAIEMAVEPAMPFMAPSEASLIITVTIPEEEAVMPIVAAYCDMAAIDMP